MRFATKILLLTLALTVGLSALIVSVVSARVTANERTRARGDIRRAIDDYLERIDHRARSSMRTVHLLLEFPQNRSYLQALNEAGPGAPEETLVHIREEVLARELQTELGATFVPPAFHALTNRRGEALALASVDPQLRGSAAGLASLAWPAQGVVESGALQKVYVELDGRLFLALGIPLRAEIGGDWVMAYFVGFEINDAWVRALSGGGTVTAAGREPLHVVVQLAGRTIASSAPGDGALTVTLPRRPAGAPATRVEQLPIEFTSGGETFVGEALLVPASAGDAVFAFYSSLDRALAPLRGLQRQILLATAGVAIVAFVVSRFISRMFARPVEQLVAGTERIARGEFGVPIEMRRRDELGALARSFNQMAAGLEQRDLIKDTFGKFVDPSVVQSLLDDPSRLRLGGERRVQTILFADLEDFTRASERLDPETLFRLLNGFLERAADVVAERRGIVDKFIGDGVVAFWGPPLEQGHALAACRAALELVERTGHMESAWRELGLPPPRVRVGLATGEVLVGNIGSRSKYNYTVMGDVANLASRLEGVNKLYGTQVLATERTVRDAGDTIVARHIDTVRVIGRNEPVALYELLGSTDDVDGRLGERVARYDAAMNLYRARRWAEAREAFDHLDDPPARAMAGRCAVLADQNPLDGWDGVWNLERK